MSDAPEEGPGSQGFSLELGEDLVQTRDWLHEFAASVIRPAAAEWDEREETPWPVLRGGIHDRAVLAGLLRPAVPGTVRARHPGHLRGAVLGRRGHRDVAGRAARWRRCPWWPTGRRSRSGSGARRCSPGGDSAGLQQARRVCYKNGTAVSSRDPVPRRKLVAHFCRPAFLALTGLVSLRLPGPRQYGASHR